MNNTYLALILCQTFFYFSYIVCIFPLVKSIRIITSKAPAMCKLEVMKSLYSVHLKCILKLGANNHRENKTKHPMKKSCTYVILINKQYRRETNVIKKGTLYTSVHKPWNLPPLQTEIYVQRTQWTRQGYLTPDTRHPWLWKVP